MCNLFKVVFVLTLSIGLFSSCEKEGESINSFESNTSIPSKSSSTSVKSEITEPLENPNNPYDDQGQKHNDVLNFIFTSYSPLPDDVCIYYDDVLSEFNVSFTSSCQDFKLIFDEDYSDSVVTFINDTVVDYDSSLLVNLRNDGKISVNEFNVVNDVIIDVHNTTNINDKIIKIKEEEDNVVNNQFLNQAEKRRVLTTFSILKYSAYYWDTNLSHPEAGFYSMLIDAMAEYWVLNDCLDCDFIQDGKDVYAFSGAASAALPCFSIFGCGG